MLPCPLHLAAASAFACLGPAAPVCAQPFDWQAATPGSQSLSSEKLKLVQESLAARRTTGLLVIRNDRIVLEWYADGHGADPNGKGKPHYTASMAKAIVGGLSLAVALTDGRIGLDDTAARFIPQWKYDARKAKITIRQLGSHTSGLEDAEAGGLPHEKLTGWKGDFWKRLEPPHDPFTISRDETPVLFEPGEQFQYSNPGIAMLTFAVTASIAGAPERDIRILLRDRVMRPIGVPDAEWSAGYGKTFTVDGLPLVGSWGGGGYTARAVARIARLMIRGGDWNGRRLISQDAVRQIATDAGTPGHGAIGWWSNASGKYSKLPRDAFWGSGAGHQVVLVVPSLDLIAVRNGEDLDPKEQHHDALDKHLFEPLIAAFSVEGRSAGPCPPSPVIRRVRWAPKETIVRRAPGSDNWPLTWGEDDALYGAYGDGNGFDAAQREKLSLGLARIEGGPADFVGTNIRSASIEQSGDGKAGKKASGLLMVGGVLYLWARNAANAQLAWSSDRGKTWTWSDWKLTKSFGCPTFLNFGKNHAGARDDFVYIYSHDQDSAYEPADRMVLARVAKSRIRERDGYELLKGFGAKSEPIWTREIDERGAVFEHKGKCYRSGVSFNAGLKRYLWCQVLPGADPRFSGGFAIYDAPEPWGPWTTVFYTETWDVGPGETSSFPTKWMTADGKTLYLVFSGEDSFSVRKLDVELFSSG